METVLDEIEIRVSDILHGQIVECCGPVARVRVDRRTRMRTRESRGRYSVKSRTVYTDMVKHDVLKPAAITELYRTALGVQNIDVGKRNIADRIIRCFKIDGPALPVVQVFTGTTANDGGIGEKNAGIVLEMISREYRVHSDAGTANGVYNQIVSGLVTASPKKAMAAARQLFSMVL